VVSVQFHHNKRIICGILLAKYQRPHDEVYSVKKRFLWKTKTVHKHKTVNTPLYLVFIPWKHQEKELIEIEEKFIINPESIQMDQTWITVEKFTSKRTESFDTHSWNESLEVNNFIGYQFIYKNNRFMIRVCLHEWWEPLTILYQNIPQLLNVDLDNEE